MYDNIMKDIESAKAGSEEAMTRLINNNSGLIWSMVRRFNGRGHELEDLYQIGALGFIKAIKRFDTNFEVQVSTYAVPYILGEIKRYIRDDGLVKVSRSIKELAIKIRVLQKEHLDKTGKEITINEIAEVLKIDKEEIALAIESSKPVESIYEEESGGENDDRMLIDKLAGNTSQETDITNRLTVNEIIKNLDNREKQVIMLRFYKDKTQVQVGKILGITQVQVSRIEKKVLEKMRVKMEAI